MRKSPETIYAQTVRLEGLCGKTMVQQATAFPVLCLLFSTIDEGSSLNLFGERSLQGFGVGGNLQPLPQPSPTLSPTIFLTSLPTSNPTSLPTRGQTIIPTALPTDDSTASPAVFPTITVDSTASPAVFPTITVDSTAQPASVPTALPVLSPAVITFSYVLEIFVSSDEEFDATMIRAEEMAKEKLEQFVEASGDAPISDLTLMSTVGDDECGNSVPNNIVVRACHIVYTTVWGTVGADVDTELAGRLFTDEIRKSFVEDFNAQSSIAQINFDYPIPVKASQILHLNGIESLLNETEQAILLDHVSWNMEGILKVNSAQVAFSLRDASITSQKEVILTNPSEERIAYIDLRVQLRAVCRGAEVCTDDAFQELVDEQALNFGQPLYQSLSTTNDGTAFDELTSVDMQGKPTASFPTFSPSATAVDTARRKRIPLWVWMLVLIDGVILIALISYVSHKRKRRVVQGDQLKDPTEQPKRISLPSVPFQPKKKPVDKKKDDIAALDLQDDEYDAKSYDFSVEAADLSQGEYSAGADLYRYSPR